MKVIDFGQDAAWALGTPYRYRVNIDHSNQSRLDVVRAWADQQGIKCTIMPGLAFFHSEVDVTLFLLRWS